MGFDYHHPAYRQARADAFSRAGGLCQNCGQHEATHAVHVALEYPPAAETQPGDLTAMCYTCQQMNRNLRAYLKDGGSIYEVADTFNAAIRQRLPGRSANPRPVPEHQKGTRLPSKKPPLPKPPSLVQGVAPPEKPQRLNSQSRKARYGNG